ncbi:MAG: hypothetical protein JXQ75_18065 [Phycisphaerae bacterium]|nr:hypothetical protein [Phycisphaerae bacterium]
MTDSLPPKPNLRFLQLQAKSLLKAQRHADARACPTLRMLERFRDASEAKILGANVMLHEAQFALALHYGFRSWAHLRHHLQTLVAAEDYSLDATRLRTQDEVPEYAAAGVPLAIVAALNHAGEEIDFVDFAAASGWAFSFGYQYEDISPAFMAVRGQPGRDGPLEVFSFLPARLGHGYQLARTREIAELWPFVVRHVDCGTPIMSEHLDGGLITAYRGEDGDREVFFDGTVCPGWIAVHQLQPYAVYVLVRERDPLPQEQLAGEAVRRAAAKAARHTWEGVPQGLAALEAYCADVANPDKDFAETEEWFCWAAFERLMARKCCAVWLRRVAPMFGSPVDEQLRAAADHYATAYEQYERFRCAVAAGEPSTHNLQQRARTPERVAAIAPTLKSAIAEETVGVKALHAAVAAMRH